MSFLIFKAILPFDTIFSHLLQVFAPVNILLSTASILSPLMPLSLQGYKLGNGHGFHYFIHGRTRVCSFHFTWSLGAGWLSHPYNQCLFKVPRKLFSEWGLKRILGSERRDWLQGIGWMCSSLANQRVFTTFKWMSRSYPEFIRILEQRKLISKTTLGWETSRTFVFSWEGELTQKKAWWNFLGVMIIFYILIRVQIYR